MVLVNPVLADAETRMKKATGVLRKELATIRTGRASPTLVENLLIDYFSVPTLLNQLAAISAPEARLILIQPWDRSSLSAIEKAILKSELGLNPTNDGTAIRLPIPPLTEERRRELTRLVGKRGEDAKIAVRNVRRDALDKFRTMEKNKEISQDEDRHAQNRLQKLTDSFVEQIDQLVKAKEREVMEV